jgi:hypothetical protein
MEWRRELSSLSSWWRRAVRGECLESASRFIGSRERFLASAFDLDAGCLPSGSRSMDGERSILRICLLDGSGWKEDALSPKT